MTHKQAREELKDNIRRLYGVKTSHYVNFEPRLTQLLELVDQYTEQKILEAKIDELIKLYGENYQSIDNTLICNAINLRIKQLKTQLTKIKEGKKEDENDYPLTHTTRRGL